MSLCRFCLKKTLLKNFTHIRALANNNDEFTSSDIVMFCLGIMVPVEFENDTKLCQSCLRKVLAYYKFKKIALKNDSYFKSTDNSVFILEEGIKKEGQDDLDQDELHDVPFFKDVPEVGYESDDDLLSAFKELQSNNKFSKIKVEIECTEDYKFNNNLELKEESIKSEIPEKSIKNLSEKSITLNALKTKKRFPCNECEKVFAHHAGLSRHKKYKHSGIIYNCDVCNKTVQDLKLHKQKVHNNKALPFGCEICKKRFTYEPMLNAHMVVHTKDRPYECEICHKSYRHKIVLESHKRQVHDVERTYLCQFCSKSFFKKYHLQIHIRSHTKEKPYKCNVCSKNFSTTTVLNSHKQIHLDVKQYQCDHCDMTFAKRAYLRNHMITHTKERRYPCHYCGVKFFRSDHRKRHMHTAHEKFTS